MVTIESWQLYVGPLIFSLNFHRPRDPKFWEHQNRPPETSGGLGGPVCSFLTSPKVAWRRSGDRWPQTGEDMTRVRRGLSPRGFCSVQRRGSRPGLGLAAATGEPLHPPLLRTVGGGSLLSQEVVNLPLPVKTLNNNHPPINSFPCGSSKPEPFISHRSPSFPSFQT